ncbi:MAG: hypothetical protein D6801_08975, partial [Alphaproteobacteria bacterium]
MFRGPRRRLDTDYVAFLGSTETFGKFVPAPFPAQVEQLIGVPSVNFGVVGAGIDAFYHDETVMHAASNARAVVVEIMGAHNLSNRFYTVHPRRNDRFVASSQMLRALYRDLDFTEFNFTRHLLARLKAGDEDRFAMVVAELQAAWVARMKSMLSRIAAPSILLWFSDHEPDAIAKCGRGESEPVLVTSDMLDDVAPFAVAVVKVVASPEEISDGFEGLVFPPGEVEAARKVLG